MSRHDRERPWLTVVKVLGAVLLVLLALVFGAGGACGVVMAVGGLWGTGRSIVIGVVCGTMLLVVAGLLVWGVVIMFRKKREE